VRIGMTIGMSFRPPGRTSDASRHHPMSGSIMRVGLTSPSLDELGGPDQLVGDGASLRRP